jgi:hypothetical protein
MMTSADTDPYLSLDIQLAEAFGDDPASWMDASSVRSVAEAAIAKLLAIGGREEAFADAIAAEVAGDAVVVFHSAVECYEAEDMNGYAFVIAVLKATAAQIVRAIIVALKGRH